MFTFRTDRDLAILALFSLNYCELSLFFVQHDLDLCLLQQKYFGNFLPAVYKMAKPS